MIETLKDLEKLLKLCRRHGVTDINLGIVALKLGDVPRETTQSADTEDESNPLADFPDGPLTPEELTYFANGGLPKDNPYRGHYNDT